MQQTKIVDRLSVPQHYRNGVYQRPEHNGEYEERINRLLSEGWQVHTILNQSTSDDKDFIFILIKEVDTQQ